MSHKSNMSGSFRQNSIHEKLHSTPSTEEKIKFAGDDSKDRLYEPKQNKKMVRVLTVVIYIFSVSLAAIMLSLYYVFFWNPKDYYVKEKMDLSVQESVALRGDNVTSTTTTTALPPNCLENHDRNGSGIEESPFPFQQSSGPLVTNASIDEDDPNVTLTAALNDSQLTKLDINNNANKLLTKELHDNT